ncbi:SCO2322 family protein [Spongiactinospora sp. TRM90649]|uniref:SCO2322 family protein n=1 Tax=Spongiactinospora sp. TRM90649 TaxID=3031114 RepID=UPI0023F6F3FA|nr:SCO2322 family protein [Spongiactinospora sp. TRM90649]MDF5758518.1 SCO2322 family protein [Spongiactinospora sp. TRM90649]
MLPLVCALVCLLVPLSPVATSAATGPVPGAPDPDAPRAWSFWESDGTAWLTAQKPAGDTVPADGSAIGWRFAALSDGVAAEAPGGDVPAFEAVCGGQTAASGSKRVAVTVDYGDAQGDAWPGETPPDGPLTKCVVTGEGATGIQVLASVARPRVNGTGQVVAIDSYPAREKDAGRDVVPAAGAATDTETETGGPSLALILAGIAVVALPATAVLFLTRRGPRVR